MIKTPKMIKLDTWLESNVGDIRKRIEFTERKKQKLLGNNTSLSEFANGYLFYGLHQYFSHWCLREWAPNAKRIYLKGDFNNWKKKEDWQLQKRENGNWEISLPLDSIQHGDLYKLHIEWEGGEGERIPSYANRTVQNKETKIFSAQVWAPDIDYQWEKPSLESPPSTPIIYEVHIGMSSEHEKVASYKEFEKNILPEIAKAGYNTIQIMAIHEHPYYGSFGYQVSNFFAPSSRFGTPEELKSLIDTAHKLEISVIMDLVHSHAVKNEKEGLALFDGTDYQYFHQGAKGVHTAWDSKCFNYDKPEVLHFLLSNCKYWLTEFKVDGFRFDGVTSMIYHNHGLETNFTNYQQYFDDNVDLDALVYLSLANELIHIEKPNAITIAEEMSGIPGLACPLKDGGIGFDFRMAMGIPDYWIKIIKDVPDEKWNVSEIFHELTNKRKEEQTINYAESHDQALVGDQTIIFRLADKNMYHFMKITDHNLEVERALRVHKMIRLLTIACSGGGYLNFMGNEFGHPDWIDFPREGNNWSYKYACRQWRLKNDPQLKYQFLGNFDKEMLHVLKNNSSINVPWINKVHSDEENQILIFERAKLYFVFNFNPNKSFEGYDAPVSKGKYTIVLNTDSPQFGGQGLVDEHMTYRSQDIGKTTNTHTLRLYIPSRTSLVFKKTEIKKLFY